MSKILKGLNESRDSWDSNMPGYRGDYGGADNWDSGKRNFRRQEAEQEWKREQEYARQQEELAQYNKTGNFWLKLKDTQQHLPAGPFIGKQAANAAALDLLKQQPELKGNLVITAYGPDEKMAEAKEAEYGAAWDEKVKRVGQLAKQGERKTVWDPVKRVYKTVPVNQSKEVDEETNPHTSAIGKALFRDLSKEKKASPQQVQRNKERWAKRQKAKAEQPPTKGMSDAEKVDKGWRNPHPGLAEDDAGDVEQRMLIKIEKEKQRLAQLKKTDPEAYQREMAKREQSRNRMPAVSTFEQQGVAEGPAFDKWADDRVASNLHKLKSLKSYQVVIMNNYYRGKYSDYSGRYFYVLARSPEEAKQVVLDNADAILQDLLAMRAHNGRRILPRSSAVPITPDRIGKIEDGTVAGRMSTASYKKMYSPNGPMMVKLSNGAIEDVQGQEQNVSEETIHVGYRDSSGDWIKTTTHTNYADAKAAMERLVKRGKKGVQHRYDNKGNIDPGAMMTARPDSGVAEGVAQGNYNVGLEDIGKPVTVDGESGYVLLSIGYSSGNGKLTAHILQPDTGAKGTYDLETISKGQQGVAEGWDSDTTRLEQDVRDALENGDDYTAKQYAKMAPTPEAKKYLLNIIKQAMYLDDLGGEIDWKGVAEDSDPCWDNYKQIGMKTKNGKKVPNCVPKEGVEEGSEQIYNILALDKGNALKKPTKLKWKASSLEDIFDALAAQDWYPLEINGVEVIAGKRLKQGVAEDWQKVNESSILKGLKNVIR